MTLKFYDRTVNSLGSFKPVINKHAVLQYVGKCQCSVAGPNARFWRLRLGRYSPFGGSGSAGILRLAAPAPEYRPFVAVPAPGYPPFVAVPALEFGQNENNIFEELTLQALYSLCLC